MKEYYVLKKEIIAKNLNNGFDEIILSKNLNYNFLNFLVNIIFNCK